MRGRRKIGGGFKKRVNKKHSKSRTETQGILKRKKVDKCVK